MGSIADGAWRRDCTLVAACRDVCEAAASGDLEQRLLQVSARGDVARMAHALNGLLDFSDSFVREAQSGVAMCCAG